MTHDEFKAEAANYIVAWGDETKVCPPSEIPLLICLTFIDEYIDVAKKMSHYWLQKFMNSNGTDYRLYGNFIYHLNFSSTLHLFGENQDSLLGDILKSKPPEDKDCKAQHTLLQFYMNKNYPAISTLKTKQKISFNNLHKKVGLVPIEMLYEYLMNTDTENWHEKAQPYFQLVMLLYFQSQAIIDQKIILQKLKESF
jgi:hypothetical protein